MSGRMKEGYRSKKLLENKVGFVSKTEFRVWPQNRASAFSRPNPQGLRCRISFCEDSRSTGGKTDRPTDKAGYYDACTRLKTKKNGENKRKES